MYTPDDLNLLLHDIFADGYVDPEERERLQAFQERLSQDAINRVCREFFRKKWLEATSNGPLSLGQKRLVAHVLEELSLQPADLPAEVRLALRDI